MFNLIGKLNKNISFEMTKGISFGFAYEAIFFLLEIFSTIV